MTIIWFLSAVSNIQLRLSVARDWLSGLHYGEIGWYLLVHSLGVAGFFYARDGYTVEILWGYTSSFSWLTVVMSVPLFLAIQLGISMGAHRKYAHKGYRACEVMQRVMLVAFAGAAQGPSKFWCPVHAYDHHGHADKPGDRHSPFRCGMSPIGRVLGFFWAHMGWLCTKEGIRAPTPRQMVLLLREDRELLEWESKYHKRLSFAVNVVPTILSCLWGDVIGGILIGWALRLSCNYHSTWYINSGGHTWGTKVEGSGYARNAWWWLQLPLAFFSVGEGYHANHHVAPRAWRLGPIDPSATLIEFCMRRGWAWENPAPSGKRA